MESFFMGLQVTANKEKTVEIELLFDYPYREMAERHARKVSEQFIQFGVIPTLEKRYGNKSAVVMRIDFNIEQSKKLQALEVYDQIMDHMKFLEPDGEIYHAPHGETLEKGMRKLIGGWVK